jgi:hypothetical protein
MFIDEREGDISNIETRGFRCVRSLYIIFFSKPKENKNEATKVRLFSNVDFEFSREEKLRSLF